MLLDNTLEEGESTGDIFKKYCKYFFLKNENQCFLCFTGYEDVHFVLGKIPVIEMFPTNGYLELYSLHGIITVPLVLNKANI